MAPPAQDEHSTPMKVAVAQAFEPAFPVPGKTAGRQAHPTRSGPFGDLTLDAGRGKLSL